MSSALKHLRPSAFDAKSGIFPWAPHALPKSIHVEFRSGTTLLNEDMLAKLGADLEAAWRCNVGTDFISGFELAQSNAVRDILMSEGMPASVIHVVELDSPLTDWPYETDYVRATLIFR